MMNVEKALEASLALHSARKSLDTLTEILIEYGSVDERMTLLNAVQALSHLNSSLKESDWETALDSAKRRHPTAREGDDAS